MPFTRRIRGTANLGDYDANGNEIIDKAEALSDGVNIIDIDDIIDLDLTKMDKDGPIDGGSFA